MADEILKRDGNYIAVLGAVTDNASEEIRMLRVDPTTKRLKVNATLSVDLEDLGDVVITGAAAGDMLYYNGTNWVNLPIGTAGQALLVNGGATAPIWSTAAGGGDVVGPASSTDNAATRFDGVTGKLLQNSTVIIGDTGNITGLGTLNTHTLPGGTDTIALIAASQTLTTKTIALGSNTISGTTAQFNTALTDNDFATLAGAETLTNKIITAATITTGLTPTSNDGAALGTTALSFSDLFLASGAVVNFNNGNMTITHSAGNLAVAGGTTTFSGAITPSANDGAALGAAATSWADLFLASGSVINFNNGDVTITHAANSLTFAGSAGYYFQDGGLYPQTNDAVPLGSTSLNWSDLFLGSGAVININNSNWVATHTSGILTVGTGDLRVTNNFTNAASVVTVGGAQTLTSKVLTSATITTGLTPTSNDGAALGTTALQFSDLFLAEGGVINWDNGDLTLTQTNNELVLAGGNLDIGANTLRLAGPLDYRVEPATDDTYEGPCTNDLNAGATIAQWDAVYLSSSSTWLLTDADASATAGVVMVALATEAGTNGNPMNVLLPGSIARNDGWTWTAGGPIYLSTTAGALTQTAPSATDDVVRIVGYALTDDCIYWNPSNDFITIV